MSIPFVPLVGNPQLEESYFSWVKNRPPALGAGALMRTKSAIESAFGAQLNRPRGSKKVTQIVLNEGGQPVYVDSDSPKYLAFQKELADELIQIEPSPKLELGVTGEGFTRGFDTMYTHGAYFMDPSLSPRVDKLGKSPAPLPALYLTVLSLVTEIYFDTFIPTTVRTNGKSKSGLPVNTKEASEKKQLFMRLLDHGRSWSDALAMSDFDYSVKYFGSAPITTPTPRDQVEKAGKVRSGYDYLGNTIAEANKTISAAAAHGYTDFHAMRRRTAYAVSYAAAAPAQAYIAGCRHVALTTYGKTWHNSVDSDVIERIYAYGHFDLWDANNFDTTFDWDELTTIIDSIPGTTDRFKDYLRTIHRLPLLVSSDMNGVAGAYLINTTDYSPGLQSGVPTVSDFGKIRGSAQWLYGLIVLGAMRMVSRSQLKKDIQDVLLHKNPDFAFQNRGDDTMPMARRKQDLDKWCDIVSKFEFVDWERDNSMKFIGIVLFQRVPGGKVVGYSDLVTMGEKSIINERSMFSNHRKFAATGNIMRYENNQNHPGFHTFMDIMDTCYTKHWGHDYLELYQRAVPFEKELTSFDLPDFAGLNQATREFLINPDVIYHKYKESDIHPDVLAAHYPSSLDPDLCEQAVHAFGFAA